MLGVVEYDLKNRSGVTQQSNPRIQQVVGSPGSQIPRRLGAVLITKGGRALWTWRLHIFNEVPID